MDYIKHYNNLLHKARNRQLPVDGRERHHVLPRCMGGTDDTENLIYLTPEEHYTAHQLLVKIYPKEDKLLYAALMMCMGSARSNNKKYGWLKRKYYIICKQRLGDKNGSFGSRWISNPDTNETYKIGKDDSLPNGFMFGRNIKWKVCEVCNIKHLAPFKRACSAECAKQSRKKVTDNIANALLFDYENGMPMNDILSKYNRKTEQSVSTFLRKRFPDRKTFLPKKRENISQV